MTPETILLFVNWTSLSCGLHPVKQRLCHTPKRHTKRRETFEKGCSNSSCQTFCARAGAPAAPGQDTRVLLWYTSRSPPSDAGSVPTNMVGTLSTASHLSPCGVRWKEPQVLGGQGRSRLPETTASDGRMSRGLIRDRGGTGPYQHGKDAFHSVPFISLWRDGRNRKSWEAKGAPGFPKPQLQTDKRRED